MATVTGNVSTFGRDSSITTLPGLQLLFIPPALGVTGGYFLVTQPVPAVIATDGSGEFTVELQPLEDVRSGETVHGPWGYSVRLQWLNGADVPIGYDVPDLLVYPPASGGPIDTMIDTPILPMQVWDADPGIIPQGARPGDLIINYRANWLGKII